MSSKGASSEGRGATEFPGCRLHKCFVLQGDLSLLPSGWRHRLTGENT